MDRHNLETQVWELAGWDEEILAKELQLLTELNIDFDIEVTGFDMGEIDVLIEGLVRTLANAAR